MRFFVLVVSLGLLSLPLMAQDYPKAERQRLERLLDRQL